MKTTTKALFDKDLANNKITITKHFEAPTPAVWEAWTTQQVLDQWWAPKPWRAETKSMNFREGGSWLYAMVGPEGERHYSRADYTKIESGESFEGLDSFTDEAGTINTQMPQTKWRVLFSKAGSGTDVKVIMTAESRNALEQSLEMGFEEGFQMGLTNLEEYLESRS